MDQTSSRHQYDSRCRCSRCTATERSIQEEIKNEADGYRLTSGPNNIEHSEVKLSSGIHAKLDKHSKVA